MMIILPLLIVIIVVVIIEHYHCGILTCIWCRPHTGFPLHRFVKEVFVVLLGSVHILHNHVKRGSTLGSDVTFHIVGISFACRTLQVGASSGRHGKR